LQYYNKEGVSPQQLSCEAMVRFSSPNDNGFKRLLGELVRWGSGLR
jgi:hypothetical protein